MGNAFEQQGDHGLLHSLHGDGRLQQRRIARKAGPERLRHRHDRQPGALGEVDVWRKFKWPH